MNAHFFFLLFNFIIFFLTFFGCTVSVFLHYSSSREHILLKKFCLPLPSFSFSPLFFRWIKYTYSEHDSIVLFIIIVFIIHNHHHHNHYYSIISFWPFLFSFFPHFFINERNVCLCIEQSFKANHWLLWLDFVCLFVCFLNVLMTNIYE